MSPTIEVSDSAYRRLKQLAGPLFSIPEVVDRLLGPENSAAQPVTQITPSRSAPSPGAQDSGAKREVTNRAPRERGVVIKLADHRINAASVRDLYEQALRWLVDGGLIGKLEPSLPHRTSSQRYLIARIPVHPNGNPFVVPASYKGYHMEAHKNYENAIGQLKQLASRAGIPFEYIA